jgi:glycosyltransferase involved in cell wall biosynthesis
LLQYLNEVRLYNSTDGPLVLQHIPLLGARETGRSIVKSLLTIIHTEASVSWGGQGVRILYEALWMRDQGHRVVILAPQQSRLMTEARRAGLEAYAMCFTKQTQVRDVFKLVGYLRRIVPDILNTHSSVDTWVGCLAGRVCHVPAIIRTRHISIPIRPHVLNRWLYRSLCDHVFTTADSVSTALLTRLGLVAHKVSTIPTGIQPPEVLPSHEEARLVFVREFNLSPNARFIGCLAILRKKKGHAILLDAFRMIQEKIPDYHLLIIGDGGYRRTLEELISAWRLQKRVHLTGYLSDPWVALRALDVKVLASTGTDGIPQAILQAQFADCPVIGSQCGGIPEVITHGKTGLLVPPGEGEPLGKAILQLLANRDHAAWLACNAKQYVSQHHTLDMMGNKILAVYDTLLEGR